MKKVAGKVGLSLACSVATVLAAAGLYMAITHNWNPLEWDNDVYVLIGLLALAGLTSGTSE